MLIGVGLGPGDPELLTLRAIKILKQSKKVYVPGSLAKELVKPYNKEIITLDFPMIKDIEVLNKIWEKNADIVAKDAKEDLVSFGSIGDPNFFSTFIHIRKKIEDKYPEIEIATIPGISSITAFASKTNTYMDESFEVNVGTAINSKIILKAKHPKVLVKELKNKGYSEFIFSERLYLDKENITSDIPDKGDYLSILYARKS
ncbi:MAG TPA: cobalt-factor II C(20)-methyltransferase [Methanosarcinales archaeon]|nr:cobalt-factor II C(20)-methyltransferase [Methanosarcinales archaeon]